MEITGNVLEILPLQSGESKNGKWQKQDFILETGGQYPKKVCISVWGEKIEQFKLATGEEIEVSINLESREFNGRWYTDVKAWKMERAGQAPPAQPDLNEIPLPGPEDEPADDLPF